MISSERVEEIFRALVLHYYTPSYNFVKYNGRVKEQPKNSPNIFGTIAHKFMTEKSIIEFISSNIVSSYLKENQIKSIKSLQLKNGIDVYGKWRVDIQHMPMAISKYLETKERTKVLISPRQNLPPLLITDLFLDKISIDILSIILYNFPSLEKKWETNDPMISDILMLSKKHIEILKKCERIFSIREIISKLPDK